MINLPGSFFAVLIAASFIALPAPGFTQSFDGRWKVSRTGVGCTPKRVIRITIEDTGISGSYRGGSGKHVISGTIAADGVFRFTAISPTDTVVFNGEITGEEGRGDWELSGRPCHGSLRIYQ